MSELKACPCGASVNEPRKEGGSDERCGYNFKMVISCECGITLSAASHHNDLGWVDDTGQALAEVVEKWNHRPTEDALQAQLESAHLWIEGLA